VCFGKKSTREAGKGHARERPGLDRSGEKEKLGETEGRGFWRKVKGKPGVKILKYEKGGKRTVSGRHNLKEEGGMTAEKREVPFGGKWLRGLNQKRKRQDGNGHLSEEVKILCGRNRWERHL